jgi:hypothetical protein
MQKFSREFGVSHLIGQRWICSFDLVSSQGNTITNKFYAISKAELLQEGTFFLIHLFTIISVLKVEY